jgi:type II secretory pathway pseudopilin PulG
MITKKGQVWIETVIYTLIGLLLIGIVLAFVTPRLNAQKDKMAVDQSISALNDFDERINTVLQAPGNIRVLSMNVKRGSFFINGSSDYIQYYFDDLSKPYSQPDVPVQIGRITVLSKQLQKGASVLLSIPYADNITYNIKDEDKVFNAAATPYKFLISNLGVINGNSGKNVISITESS